MVFFDGEQKITSANRIIRGIGVRVIEILLYLEFCRGGGHRSSCQIYALLVNSITDYHDYGIHAQAGELHNYRACYRHVESLHWEIKENSSKYQF